MLSWLGRAAIRISTGSLLTAIVAGVPAWLVIAVGWPLPARVPDRGSLTTFLTGGVTDRMVVNLLAIAIWLVWMLFAQAVCAELRDTIRGVKDLHLRAHRNPLRSTASILVSSMLLGTVLTATAATASPHAAAGAAVAATPRALPAVALATVSEGPATIHVGNQTYVYVVKRADSLSKISAAWLGDADRWPEVCRLNKHRHFATVGGTLRDCNLIFPGWDLRLPADAKPPSSAKTGGTQHPTQPPAAAPTTTASPSASAPTSAAPSSAPATTAADPSSPAATTSSTAAPSSAAAPSSSATAAAPAASPAASGSPTSASVPASSASAASAPDTTGTAASHDEHGVQLSPSSWVPWILAAAISAATLLVWRQRRRRYTGEPDDAPPTELPPPVVTLRRAVNRNPELPNPDDSEAEPPGLPDLAPLPPGGTGLVGDGATAAARAALVAVLASGGPHHPDARAEVIIDAATLATLLGPDVVTLGHWPRLHLADNLDDALTATEARLLHRSRILDEHTLTDLDELRTAAPDEEALPPVMLITETPPAGARMRAKVALALGEGLHVSALLLGEWAHGATMKVASDGHTTLVSGQPSEPMPSRLPVLEPGAAIQILTTLREAQTGEPPAITSPAIPVTVVPLHASRTENTPTDTTPPTVAVPDSTEPAPAAPAVGEGRARLRVLGRPRIEDITAEGRPLRAKALELAVYLAVHPDGAATREIGEYLEPDARVNQADQRVHTNASNLRHVLGRAGIAEAKNAYVIKSAGRYRLDPATVDVDVWTLRDLMRKATIASEPHRRGLLAAACDLCSAPLAEGQDYEWIQPHRETVRRWGTEAHLMLADDLLDNDPQAASDLLDNAIGMDRYNEALYVKAMHARHALADADGIRTLLRALTKALADLDAEPREDTLELANTLRTSLDSK
ncbi:transcriptional regulator [Actinoplanes derwentensis]|uniref:DNA-binding transcriptional activator of the SARP family n=1 Tax=Actinoplanes derwentensis TaxID=113562 RepID=A0A1H1XWN0_9ACTN|nr:transcriptional regulator [Actinoplanes derwentensis]GID90284.1 hypothetical protein Ade03nite_92080 [Actinoplanes derwentensis]SDT13657.1 DNA-binding transcriptional activator of the SARP family [Actinoplanes derwentensis]